MKYILCLIICLFHSISFSQTNILKDQGFARGFEVYMVEDGVPNLPLTVKKVISVNPKEVNKPEWQLAQWNNYNNRMEFADYTLLNDQHLYETKGGNKFLISPVDNMVMLGLSTSSEYGKNEVSPDNPRKEGQKWPHLLISQTMNEHAVKVSDYKSISMKVDYCINSIKDNHEKGTFNKNLHSSQFQWFISVNNKNRESKGYGDYFWFGFSFYDFRYLFSPFYANVDTNTTGKFIYMPDMREVLGEGNSTGIGKTKSFYYEINKQLEKAFNTAKENGFLKDTNWQDLYIGHTNIGWEVTGSFDVQATISNLGIIVKP